MKKKSPQPQSETNGSQAASKSGDNPTLKKPRVQTPTGQGNVIPDQHTHSTETSMQTVLSTLPSALQKSGYCKRSLEMVMAAVKPPADVACDLILTAMDSANAEQRASEHPRPHKSSPQTLSAELPLSEIKADRSVQCRAGINNQTVAQYAELMKAGEKFPHIDVFNDGREKIVADGQHRFHAALQAGLKTIAARIHQGDRKDAIKFAIQANTTHGLRFTNKDKRHAVELALKEFPDWTAGVIAELCKVSQPFVSKLSKQLITVMSSTKVGRDGKTRKVTHKKKGDRAAVGAATSTEQANTTGASAQNFEDESAPGSREEFDLAQSLERCDKVLWAELNKCPPNELQLFIDGLEVHFKDMKAASASSIAHQSSGAIE